MAKRNEGRLPRAAQGKRVRVKLRNGKMPPESWAADGKNGCRWTLTDDPHDIVAYEIE